MCRSLVIRHIAEPRLSRFTNRLRVPQWRIPPPVDIREHPLHPLLEGDLRLPAKRTRDFCNVGEGAIGLARASGHVLHRTSEELHQPVDRLRTAGAEVEA